MKPDRASWGDFPDVVIQAAEATVRRHPEYAAAKAGDVGAAKRLIAAVLPDAGIARLREELAGVTPMLVPVYAEEAAGINRIPGVFTEILGEKLGLDVTTDIIQINRVEHTGADGWHRLATPALFDGDVARSAAYFLVDDFVGQGGTLANLRGFIMAQGGQIAGATTLTGKEYSAKLALSTETLEKLRAKHGTALENWWRETFGYGFDFLTESEARYLTRSEDAYTIRERILAARSETND